MSDFKIIQGALDRHDADNGRGPVRFTWKEPETLPRREWLYGRHLMRGQVSVTVAPGGVGKSSLTIVEALAMVTGKRLLGDWTAGPLNVWVFNLEDPRDELERRILAAARHYGIGPDDIGERLFVDTGRERELCVATETRQGVVINRPELDTLEEEIKRFGINVLIVDPFVSSHQISENDNGAMDRIAKEWARLATRCGCAIELVHHTRKLNGEEANSEAGRGASALLNAARSGRVLQRMSDELKAEAGVQDDPATYFAVTRDKANLAPAGKRVWRRMASVELGNGDSVGVAEAWEWPDTFEGVSATDLLAVQHAIHARAEAGEPPRYSDQAGKDWAGVVVAEVLGLDANRHRRRIKSMLTTWELSGAVRREKLKDAHRETRPCLVVGEWASE